MRTRFSRLEGVIELILLSLSIPLMLKVRSEGTPVAGIAIISWAIVTRQVSNSLVFSWRNQKSRGSSALILTGLTSSSMLSVLSPYFASYFLSALQTAFSNTFLALVSYNSKSREIFPSILVWRLLLTLELGESLHLFTILWLIFEKPGRTNFSFPGDYTSVSAAITVTSGSLHHFLKSR